MRMKIGCAIAAAAVLAIGCKSPEEENLEKYKEARLNMAYDYYRRGNHVEAYLKAVQIIAEEPDNVEALKILGGSAAPIAAKELEDAASLAEIDPVRATTILQGMQNHISQGIWALDKVLKKDKDDPWAHYLYGRFCYFIVTAFFRNEDKFREELAAQLRIQMKDVAAQGIDHYNAARKGLKSLEPNDNRVLGIQYDMAMLYLALGEKSKCAEEAKSLLSTIDKLMERWKKTPPQNEMQKAELEKKIQDLDHLKAQLTEVLKTAQK